jgi:hypothetical protein
MTKRTNPRKDFTQIAFSVVQRATGDAPPEPEVDPKKKAAIESGRKGGQKGGAARAKKLTAEMIQRPISQLIYLGRKIFS